MGSSMTAGNDDGLALEITVLSAESLQSPSLLPCRLRPYVVLSSAAGSLLRTRVDEAGSHNPTWGDTLRVPVGPSFLRAAASASADSRKHEAAAVCDDAAVHVSILSKGLFAGATQLGRCCISAADVLDGLRPPGARRRLSYALRCPRYGGRGHGVVHVAVRLVGQGVDRLALPPPVPPPQPGWCRMAIGIPAAAAAASPVQAPASVAGGGSWL